MGKTESYEARMPCVSVIVANYNRADLLREALQSVFSQDFKDFEILVVDDGSVDHSLDVIDEFWGQEPNRLKLFTHEGHSNKGIPATYGLGISRARGIFVAFLEHDDLWPPEYLGSKVEILRRNPEVSVVFSPYRVIGEGWFGWDMMLRQWLLGPISRKNHPFDNFENLLRFNNIATFSCFVTRKELLDKLPSVNGHTPFFDWWVLAYLSSRGLFQCDLSSTASWRMSKQSTMGMLRYETLRNQVCDFLEQMYQQIDDENCALSAFNRTILKKNRALLPYFLNFYRQPGIFGFARFFLHSPSWSVASLLSAIVNYFKFR